MKLEEKFEESEKIVEFMESKEKSEESKDPEKAEKSMKLGEKSGQVMKSKESLDVDVGNLKLEVKKSMDSEKVEKSVKSENLNFDLDFEVDY